MDDQNDRDELEALIDQLQWRADNIKGAPTLTHLLYKAVDELRARGRAADPQDTAMPDTGCRTEARSAKQWHEVAIIWEKYAMKLEHVREVPKPQPPASKPWCEHGLVKRDCCEPTADEAFSDAAFQAEISGPAIEQMKLGVAVDSAYMRGARHGREIGKRESAAEIERLKLYCGKGALKRIAELEAELAKEKK